MRPTRVLNLYYLATFIVGLVLTVAVAHWVRTQDVGVRGAAIMALCWNVLFVMLLPVVMDWGECRYFKARFLALDEVSKTNPELAVYIAQQCKKKNIANLRFAVVDTVPDVLFTYGLWRNNPRLVVSSTFFAGDKSRIIPSIEAELVRFTSRDHTVVYLIYTLVQVLLMQGLLAFLR